MEKGVWKSWGLKSVSSFSHNVFYHLKFYRIKGVFNPLPDYKILDWFKLKQIMDNILKCT